MNKIHRCVYQYYLKKNINKNEKYNIVQRSEPKKKPLTAKELFGI